jgi:hypothetical protein
MPSADLVPTLVVAALYGVGIPLYIFLAIRASRTRKAVQRGDDLWAISRILGGEVLPYETAFEGPVVRFDTQGHPSYCRQWLLFEGRSTVVTTFECRAGFRGFFEATSLRALRYPSRSPRFRVLRTSSGFQLVTTSTGWAENLLDAGLREILREIGRRCRRARVQLTADRFLLEVESRLSLREISETVGFLGRIAALAGTAEFSAGISFVGNLAVGIQGRCPVCCQPLEPPGVSCGHCRAPHHRDCWAYWGRCAIFGCRGRQAA